MPKGVKIKEIVLGTGQVAERGMIVVAKVEFFLNGGDKVTAEYPEDTTTIIDLGHRETIAGLRYGIEGMRVGGHRKLIISPHLAYGAAGMGKFIPPNAVLHCDVELVEIRVPGVQVSGDYPPGKQLHVFMPGEGALSIPRCQFDLHENGRGGAFVTHPVPGYGWRPARTRRAEFHPDAQQVEELFRDALALPANYPGECIPHEALWSDSSEPANGITRDQATNTRCITISVDERGEQLCYYSMKHDSPAWENSAIHRIISAWLEPHLIPSP